MHRLPALAMLLAFCAPALHAQTAPPDPALTPAAPAGGEHIYALQDLIGLALAINPKDHEIQQQAVQAHLASDLVSSQYAPQLSLQALGGNQRTPLAITRNVSPRGYIVSSSREVIPALQLKWLLFDFGRRKGQLDAARQNALAADASALDEQEKLVFDVSKAYFDASSAQGKVRAAGNALAAARLTEEAVVDQRQHGRATVVQVAEAHRQTAAAQVALTRASGDTETTFATLAATVGLPPESHFALAASTGPELSAKRLPALKSLIDEAMWARPDLAAAQSNVAAAAAQVDAAHAAFRPTISLQAQVFQNIGRTRSDGGPYSTVDLTGNSVFVAFDLPLFDGGARRTKLSMAISQQSQAEDALAAARNTATQQVVESYNDLKTSIDNRIQAKAYVDAAKLAYQASLASFKRGITSVNDVTNDEAALAQAEAGQEDADDQVQVAQAAVSLAVGRRLGP